MLQPRQLGYVALDVADLDASVRFYRDVVHFEVNEERDGAVFMTGGIQHHWLALRQSSTPGLNRVAFEMENLRDLEAMEKKLKGAGVSVERGSNLARDRVDSYIRFRDPDGVQIELFTDMVTLPAGPIYAHRVHTQKLLHAVLLEKQVSKSVPFYTDLLGFQISDWIEKSAAFMRCGDHYHHSLGVFGTGGTRTAIDHICILVPTLDDVMRARANVMAMNVPLRSDLLRHAPSGSVAIYLRDEANNLVVEFCTEHRQILDENHRPRVLPSVPEALDIWQIVGPSYDERRQREQLALRERRVAAAEPPPRQVRSGAPDEQPLGEIQTLERLGVSRSAGAEATGK